MRTVVIGATGNLGTSLVPALVADADVESVVGLSRRPPDRAPEGVSYVAADIVGSDLASLLRGAEAVIHLAWIFQPTHDPIRTWSANVLGGIRTFEAIAAAGVKTLVYASSIGAYSPGPGQYVDETWPTHGLPTAAYSREKAYLERYLDAFEYRHPDIRVVRLRTAFVFKRESASEQRRLFGGPLVPRALLSPGRLPVLPVPANLKLQALHSDDAADAFRRALLSQARGAFNVAADPVLDGHALAELLQTRAVTIPRSAVRGALAAAWRLHLVPADAALFDLLLQLPILDARRIKTELGWAPQHTGAQALSEMLDGLVHGAGGSTAPLAPDRAAGKSP